MEKQISEFTLVELKAAAYDCISNIQHNQTILNIINEELSRRNSVPKIVNSSIPIERVQE